MNCLKQSAPSGQLFQSIGSQAETLVEAVDTMTHSGIAGGKAAQAPVECGGTAAFSAQNITSFRIRRTGETYSVSGTGSEQQRRCCYYHMQETQDDENMLHENMKQI